MIDIDDIDLEKRYYCFECGQQSFACDVQGHVCFDRFPHLIITYTKPKWHNRFFSWLINNFTGILGFIGVNTCSTVFAHHFGFKGFDNIFFIIGAGFLCAYVFLMARND